MTGWSILVLPIFKKLGSFFMPCIDLHFIIFLPHANDYNMVLGSAVNINWEIKPNRITIEKAIITLETKPIMTV